MKRALVIGAAVALIAACSGSSGPTKAEYVRQANSICRAAAATVAEIKFPARSDVEGMPKAAAAVVEAQREALERLRDIRPPKKDRAQITKWIALVDQTIDQAEVSAESQREGDIQRAVTANLNGAALDQRADEIARELGVRRCVQAAAPPSTTTTTAPAGT